MTVSREDLLKERFGVEAFELAGVGTVEIRSVSREVVLGLRGREPALTALEQERLLVSAAMVSPKMSQDDVAAWQAASPAGELEPLTEAIMRLSGLRRDAPKEAVKQFRG